MLPQADFGELGGSDCPGYNGSDDWGRRGRGRCSQVTHPRLEVVPISGRVVLVSLASVSSPILPHSATQMTLSLFLLISTLAAWLVDTKAAAFERREMHDTLRRHLGQHRVSPLLAYVVQTQVARRMRAREHVRQDDGKALHCISPALSKSLAFAVHRKNLATVRILGALQGADDGFFERGVLVWRRLSSSFC